MQITCAVPFTMVADVFISEKEEHMDVLVNKERERGYVDR